MISIKAEDAIQTKEIPQLGVDLVINNIKYRFA